MEASQSLHNYSEMLCELELIATKSDTIPDDHAKMLLKKTLKIDNKTRALQFFSFVLLFFNKIHLIHERKIFCSFSSFLSRLEQSNTVYGNVEHIKALAKNQNVPPYPSIILFCITHLVLARKLHTKSDYHKELGRAWLNIYESKYTFASAPSENDIEEDNSNDHYDNERQKMISNVHMLLYRLRQSEKMMHERIISEESTDKDWSNSHDMALYEAIKKYRSTKQEDFEKNPYDFFGVRNDLIRLAAKTGDNGILTELYDACKNFGEDYQKY